MEWQHKMSAWTKISHQVLTGNTASISFNSIPQSYTDLIVFISGRTNLNVYRDDMAIYFNSNSNGYSYRGIRRFENGAINPLSGNNGSFGAIFSVSGASATTNSFSNTKFTITNYTGSSPKPYTFEAVMGNNSTNSDIYIGTGFWNNSSAVTSVSFSSLNGNSWVANTTATLYGVTAGSSGGVTVS